MSPLCFCSATLAQLSREQVFQRHLLRGLSRDETGRLAEETAGIRPSPPLVENVFAHTEGNPYFLTEVVRLLSQQGELGGAETGGLPSLRIPEGVREVIGQRLNRLSSECNRVLATASIIGREFSLDQLVRLFDDPSGGLAQRLAEDQVLEALEDAREVRLIEELPQTVGRYQFAHRLAQETLIQELSLTQRVRLHARIALALEELYGVRVEEHAAELAYHFTQAETVTGAEKLVRYCLLAGEQALAAYAAEEALPLFERALVAREDQPADANTAALLFGLARAQIATFERHRQEVAVSNLARALEYYAEVGDADRAVAVAEFPDYSLGLPSVSQLTIRALSLVPADSHQAGRLLCRYGQYIGLEESDYDAAQSAFGRALAIARREGDSALEMRTLADAAGVYSFHMCWEEVMASALKAIELARVAEDPRSEVAARYFAITALTTIGDSEAARRHASAMLVPAERLRDHFWLKSALWKNGMIYRLTGEWATSREYNDHSLAVSPWYTTLSDRVLLECELGDFTQSKARLDELLEVVRTSIGRARITAAGYVALVIPLFARITGILDQLDTAKRAGETILSSRFAHPNAVSHARAGLGLVAFLRDDLAAAGEQYAELGSVRGTMLWWFVSGDRLLALLSITMERFDQAVDHFEDSLEFCRNAGYRPELAWAYCDYADALLRRASTSSARTDDKQRAVSLLYESRSIATELGMPPLMERTQDRLDRIGTTAPEAPEYPSGLSQREVEVLRLVALGKSNREIGDELAITERTVRPHVSNIYQKIGANNRSEATSYALREGLVSFE